MSEDKEHQGKPKKIPKEEFNNIIEGLLQVPPDHIKKPKPQKKKKKRGTKKKDK